MTKLVQIIPYDGIGGVESAARSVGPLNNNNFQFSICYIYNNIGGLKARWKTFNPWPFISIGRLLSQSDVDVIIMSLWRSVIPGIIAKVLRPRIKLVSFLHNSKDAHLLDFFFTRLGVLISAEVWADSSATITHRVPKLKNKICRVISFVTKAFDDSPEKLVAPSFVFWGRISKQKDIERALVLFSGIYKRHPDARLQIIGPDGGALPNVQELCASLGLCGALRFTGVASLDEIADFARQASFYLQTSRYEGMAMSVVEAMQLGLVPVVTPVGEIATYCRHGENSVVVRSDEAAILDIEELLKSNVRYQALRANAIATWKGRPLYRESFLAACEAVGSGALQVNRGTA